MQQEIDLVSTFADQAVIAIENARLFEQVQARTRELTESLEQQTATSDVLGVISSSQGALQPVFETMLSNAVRICEAKFGNLLLYEGDVFRFVAMSGAPPAFAELRWPSPVIRPSNGPLARIVVTKQVQHVADITTEQSYLDRNPTVVELVGAAGARTLLGVPMLKDNELIGVIVIYRQEVRPFSEKQIELVNNFASQAVIAIENTRLLNELRESLQQQTATADVLKVISRSAFDLQAVLDTLAASAARLCDADQVAIHRREGDVYPWSAISGLSGDSVALLRKHMSTQPLLPGRASVVGRAVLECRPVQIPDVCADPEYTLTEAQRIAGHRAAMGVPLLREGVPIGAMALLRTRVTAFNDKEIELAQTFADQAVIAIENTRLFEEVQARTKELETALERQTATSEILGVISQSPGNLEPVFHAILKSARELCAATFGHLLLSDGQTWRPAALQNIPKAYADVWDRGPIVAAPETILGHLVATRQPFHVLDGRLGEAYRARIPIAVATVDLGGARTLLGVPLLKDGNVIGAIVLYRTEVRSFDDQQIALLSSFAAQAVIAIENARLLADLQERQRELARSVEELKSLGEVSGAVNASLDLDKVLPTVLQHACAMAYASGGTMYVFDKVSGQFHLAAGHNMSEEHIAMVRAEPVHLGTVVVGQCAECRAAVQIADLDTVPPSPVIDILRRTGVRAVLAVPLLHQGEVVGALVVRRNHPGAFSAETIRLLEAFAAQSAIAVHNARLFEEIAQKSHELEIASQHKSQFVANMSHELRTPLAAMLGYAELLQEGIYGAPPEKFLPILTRIRSNGNHLLGLINTVLDISKIEAGQFKLNLGEYALASIVETVMGATESLAATKKLAFTTEVAKGMPYGLGDEQRLTQVLLNLVGNAIKFTDAGEVRITAGAANGHFTVSVSDTGPGIPAEECEYIFEKFRQVDSSNTRAKGGTGLGLAIAREIVEMHGGRIWVESTMGQGSTFRMELPVRAAAATGAA
jgi:signal transduction histidine kinase